MAGIKGPMFCFKAILGVYRVCIKGIIYPINVSPNIYLIIGNAKGY